MLRILESASGIDRRAIERFIHQLTTDVHRPLHKVLLIPPDITRLHSCAGLLTAELFRQLEPNCHCDILPAVGTHMAMTRAEQVTFFGDGIPADRFLTHHWRTDTLSLGIIPAGTVSALSDGLLCQDVPVEVNKALVEGDYDHIFSIGPVIPHEVVGMANYSKNLLVGCGGERMISLSHLLGVLFGTERSMGQDQTPVRRLFDYAQEHYLSRLPLTYLLTVTQTVGEDIRLHGLYSGSDRACFDHAVALSQAVNIKHTEKPIHTCLVYLDPDEFRTSWLGNKAIYRTRNAFAPDARLFILAPGFTRFGEDETNDRLIRKYGYIGSEAILRQMKQDCVLSQNLSVVAHLAQGSSDGKFTITYLTPEPYADAIRNVGYEWADSAPLLDRISALHPGWNQTSHGEIYYIPNPALGLWVYP